MSWDTTWEKVFVEQEWGKYPAESLIRFVARNFYTKQRNLVKILEVGCGPGANLWYLSREGFDTYGIDGSPTAINKAEERLDKEGLKANLLVDDIINMPYEDSFFDAVIDVECLCCNSTENTRRILAEIKRILKPDGKLYSRTFTDQVYVGDSTPLNDNNEYFNVIDGPLAEKGFVRLTTEKSIIANYGKFFDIEAVDLSEYTFANRVGKVSEWIIIAKK